MKVKVGIAGFGTVGSGTYELITKNKSYIKEKTSIEIEIVSILEKDWEKERKVIPPTYLRASSLEEFLEKSEIVVELIGGTSFSKELIERAIEKNKHVVSANKHLLALYGKELFKKAKDKGVLIEFEASVGGGIPIIKALKEGLVANSILSIEGILNGTTNYILTKMLKEGLSFDRALDEAKKLGYAEADPSFDIDGIDAAHKISILSFLAFGSFPNFSDVYVEGIRDLNLLDVILGKELGYTIKLLAISKKVNDEIEIRVHPAFIKDDEPLSKVDDVFNAILIEGDFVDRVMLYGKGAGSYPTASAVVSDIIDIAKKINFCDKALSLEHQKDIKLNKNFLTRYYIRFDVEDKVGVLASIANVFAKYNISIASVLQKEMVCKLAKSGSSQTIPLVLLTHTAREKDIKKALLEIKENHLIKNEPVLIRVESKE